MEKNFSLSVDALVKENVKLYEENLKLKMLLENNHSSSHANVHQNNKGNQQHQKKSTTTSNTQNIQSTQDKRNNLTKFQQEREYKKEIVAEKMKENIPVPEIAKIVNQSEPTVRNYIRELRIEGKLSR